MSFYEVGKKCFISSEFTEESAIILMNTCNIFCIDSDGNTYIYPPDFPDKIVGFGAVKDHHLMSFFIDPDYQCIGLGTKLLKYIIRFYKKLTLHVRVTNKALQLYQKIGFKIIKEISNYYSYTDENENAYFMEYIRPKVSF